MSRRSNPYKRAMRLFRRFFEGLDEMNRKYMLIALETALERWDPSPLYHYLSFKERGTAFHRTEFMFRPPSFKSYPQAKVLVLPRPAKDVKIEYGGHGICDFHSAGTPPRPPTLQQLSNLLYYSVSSPHEARIGEARRQYLTLLDRPALEIYLYTELGGELEKTLSHYLPHIHSLELIRNVDLSKDFYLATGDASFRNPYVVIVLTIRYNEVFHTGLYRAYRLAFLEAGSALSHIIRVAMSLEMRGEVSFDFIDRAICTELNIDCYDEFPVAILSLYSLL